MIPTWCENSPSCRNDEAMIPATISFVMNGLFAFLFIVFAGAGAGNAGQSSFFPKILLPIELGVLLLIFAAWLAFLVK